jgi:hypothetical protein
MTTAPEDQSERLLPCPFCGHVGLDFSEGSTFRWLAYSCGNCGIGGETRMQTLGEGTREEWRAAAERDARDTWNARAALRAKGAPASPADVSMYRALVDAECRDADELLRLLGFNPEDVRTEGGNINLPKVRAAIKHPADYPLRAPKVEAPTWDVVRPLAIEAGFNLDPTPNMLYTVRGNSAQLLNFARLLSHPLPALAPLPEVSSHKQGDALQGALRKRRDNIADWNAYEGPAGNQYISKPAVLMALDELLAATPPQAPRKDQG